MNPTHFIITVILSAVVAVGSIFVLGKDNPIEEAGEAIIESQTGLDIDFSSESENKEI